MDNSPRLTAAERRYLATHPACVATRRRAEDAADLEEKLVRKSTG